MPETSKPDPGADEWNETGSELRQVDPALYLEILVLAQRAVLSHKRPELLRASGQSIVSLRRGEARGSA